LLQKRPQTNFKLITHRQRLQGFRFPEALLLVSVRTGPLTASLTSIYEDKAAFDRSAEERTKRMAANGHLMDGVIVEEGEVTLFHVK